ncbi:hypothetical protein HPT25_23225 [Bacillus sp. BRMEA1]|nr:hypothetical protein [Neobacillus endophyticus]NRD80237.1 hypothetical protein [Neobacillus endophyticus]
MSINHQKKETEKGFVNSEEQEQLEHSTENDKAPEFDVLGTALNGL